MESKTKHRILGCLVLAGLIVILLPFMQSRKELSSDVATIKSPPFPDQSVQVTAETSSIPIAIQTIEDVKQAPDDTISTDHPTDASKVAPQIPNPVIENNKIDTQPKDNKQPLNSESSDNSNPPAVTQPVTDSVSLDKVETPVQPAEPVKKATTTNKRATFKFRHIPYIQTPIDNNGLFKLQTASYVIHVGSFKNKASALKVVNNLRANGYRAFIQCVSTSVGENTRVFVGPETRQASARELAQRIESEMKLKGVVISYKPLSL